MKNKLYLSLTEEQNNELNKFFNEEFPHAWENNFSSFDAKKTGVILGHPDMNHSKIQFIALPYWEYKIVRAAFLIVSALRGELKEKSQNVDRYGMYSLENAETKR